MPERTTDELLLQKAGKGDQAAFLELYDRHRDPIFRFAYRLLGSVEIAEDITHDCFLSLIRRPEGYRPERAALRTYLFAIARNLALKHFRNTGRETGLEEMTDEPEVSPRHTPLRRLLDEELAGQVRDAIFNLPDLQREALILYEYEGLSLNEIAAVVDADAGAIKARLYRARERLKRVLRPYLDSNQELNSGREIVTLKEA
ncbi:MAG TPA: RNA polymerase sigma factor [Pyrinomonadaceae bacterium]|nr:RNA polymerase sigma factor [Pyrinomonadaceae bacterium]